MTEALGFYSRAEQQIRHQAHKRSLGVSWKTSRGMWLAKLGKRCLGLRKDQDEAIKLRLMAEKDLYGVLPEREWLFKELLPHHVPHE